jgi:hypothetical protein
MRRGYHFLPKHIFGQPTDAFFRSGPHLPAWLAQPLLAGLLRVLVGDLRRYGLPKPDHRVLETHPIVNSQLLHYLAHGDITARPDIAELRGRTVRFTDGTEDEFDLIVYATGYRASLPVLDESLLPAGAGAAPFFLNIFHERPNLYAVGLFETDGAAYPIVSKQAALIAALVRAERESPAVIDWFRRLRAGKPPDLHGGIHYLKSQRHSIYVQYDEYVHFLEKSLKRIARMPRTSAAAPREGTPSAVPA